MIHIVLAILAFIVLAGFSAAIIDLLLTHWRVVAVVVFVVLMAAQIASQTHQASAACHPPQMYWQPTLVKCD